MEIYTTGQKRVLSSELLDKYEVLPKVSKREVKDLYNKKFEIEKDGRINGLVGQRETPSPREEDYLTKIIQYHYDHMNGTETMSFEEIENL